MKNLVEPQDRDKIALKICAEIQESEREKERLRERWIRLREIHDCEESTAQVQLIEGMKPYMLPLSRTKADRIVGAITDGITGISPYVQVFDEGNTNSNLDDLAMDLQTLAEDAGDVEAIRTGSEDAVITNAGVWRIKPYIDEPIYDAPSTDQSGGADVTRCDWEAIDPIDVCCYPPYFGTFASAKTVGHRFSSMLFEVKGLQKDGTYFDDVMITGGDDPMKHHRYTRDVTDDSSQPVDSLDEFVELWEVITRIDLEGNGEYKRYLCVVAMTQQKLLNIQEYPYSVPWYIEVRTTVERNRIFPRSSVSQRLQGLQLAYSDLFTADVQAVFASIGPITFLTGGASMAKVKQAKPFMMVELPQDIKVQTVVASPQVGGIPGAMEKIEETADALTGISRNGVGQQLPSSTTATEVDALQSAAAEAKDQYTQVVAGSVERVYKLLFEYYKTHFVSLKAAYGDRLKIETQADIDAMHPQFRVNGKNGSQSNIVVIQKLQTLMGLLAQTQNPNSPPKYDLTKIIDMIVQLLDLPFDIKRLEADPQGESSGIPPEIVTLLTHPDVINLLMQGVPLPEILQKLQNPNGQQANSGAPAIGGPVGGDGQGPIQNGPPALGLPGANEGPVGGIPTPLQHP